MTVTEARAVNILLRELFEVDRVGLGRPTKTAVRREAEYLAERADKALAAGVRRADIEEARMRR